MPAYRNATHAFVGALREIEDAGERVPGRTGETRELVQHALRVERPAERFVAPPGRNGSPFATVAETLWVLAGRDDIAFLEGFMPQAARANSDDGKTWRAAYGPRLRAWPAASGGTVDQVAECVRLILDDPTTERASAQIWDPARDHVDSKDIPCNNRVDFLARGDAVHACVAVRSNDAWFGFSGINSFEWSVLQEAVASWTGRRPGNYVSFAGSFHLYERHYAAAARVRERFTGRTMYDYGLEPVPFDVPLARLDADLAAWFAAEALMREGKVAEGLAAQEGLGRFLGAALRLAAAFHFSKRGDAASARGAWAGMEESDFKAAAAEWLLRQGVLRADDPALGRAIGTFLRECGHIEK